MPLRYAIEAIRFAQQRRAPLAEAIEVPPPSPFVPSLSPRTPALARALAHSCPTTLNSSFHSTQLTFPTGTNCQAYTEEVMDAGPVVSSRSIKKDYIVSMATPPGEDCVCVCVCHLACKCTCMSVFVEVYYISVFALASWRRRS